MFWLNDSAMPRTFKFLSEPRRERKIRDMTTTLERIKLGVEASCPDMLRQDGRFEAEAFPAHRNQFPPERCDRPTLERSVREGAVFAAAELDR